MGVACRARGVCDRLKCVDYKILVGKPERKRPLGRPWPRWEDNIKIYLKESGLEC